MDVLKLGPARPFALPGGPQPDPHIAADLRAGYPQRRSAVDGEAAQLLGIDDQVDSHDASGRDGEPDDGECVAAALHYDSSSAVDECRPAERSQAGAAGEHELRHVDGAGDGRSGTRTASAGVDAEHDVG